MKILGFILLLLSFDATATDRVWRMRRVHEAIAHAADPATPVVRTMACLREYAQTLDDPAQYEDVSRLLQVAMDRDPHMAVHLGRELWTRQVALINWEVTLWFQSQFGRGAIKRFMKTETDDAVKAFLIAVRGEFSVESGFTLCTRALRARGPFH